MKGIEMRKERNISLPYSLPLWPSMYLDLLRDAHYFLLYANYFYMFIFFPLPRCSRFGA
jgi:hypothetical protein